jgi:O-antigen/teichoic acid export membrane protein
LARRFASEVALVRSSSLIFAGFSVARLLGFLFFVVAARVLTPDGFGQVSYVLALATIASVFLSSSPVGLSRFLSRHAGDPREQESYLANWLTVVGGLVLLSVAAAVLISLLARLDGWMMLGLAVNLVGIAVLETYREVQRGLGRFVPMTVFFALANLLQLLAVVVAVILGWRSPALLVLIYGSSSLAAWAVMEGISPVGLRFDRSKVDADRLRAVFRFAQPLLIQSVFFAVWFSADLIFVQWTLNSAATGNYAAAKVLASALWLAPTAIGMTVVPRIARLSGQELLRYVAGVLALTTVIMLVTTAALVWFGWPLIAVAFGERYRGALIPLGVLAVGMGMHGLYITLFNVWIGLGRPMVNMVSAAAGMVCSVLAAALLVRPYGLMGAAWSFTIGSTVRVAIIATYTTFELGPEIVVHSPSDAAKHLVTERRAP